jgi:hypothetical protein
MSTPAAADRPILPTTLPRGKVPRQVFVAYSYKLYPTDDYRAVYQRVGKAFGVNFVFANEKITNLHILEKIANFIRESQFSIYDISGWNPNVTMELGLSFGFGEKAFIAFDPSKTPVDEVPADIRGIDRLQYSSYSELEGKLAIVIGQEFPPEQKSDPMGSLMTQIVEILTKTPGLHAPELATALGVSRDLTSFLAGQMVDKELETRGVKRGTRYYVKGTAPPRPA